MGWWWWQEPGRAERQSAWAAGVRTVPGVSVESAAVVAIRDSQVNEQQWQQHTRRARPVPDGRETKARLSRGDGRAGGRKSTSSHSPS